MPPESILTGILIALVPVTNNLVEVELTDTFTGTTARRMLFPVNSIVLLVTVNNVLTVGVIMTSGV
jgi:hypothetical protein